MKFTDIFIKKPVFAISISLVIILLGLQSVLNLDIRQYPQMVTTTISISVTNSGTSAQDMNNYIVAPIEEEVAKAEDIDYISSSSQNGSASINVKMKEGTDPNIAYTNILAKVNLAKRSLPSGTDDPIVSNSSSRTTAQLYMAFMSSTMSSAQVSDYVSRYIKPQFFTVSGVASVDSYDGGMQLVVTLDPLKLNRYGLSATVVANALAINNLQIPSGQLSHSNTIIANNINGTVKSVKELQNLIINTVNGKPIKLSQVAEVKFAAPSDTSFALTDGQPSVLLGLNVSPGANPIAVVKKAVEVFDNVVKTLPPSIKGQMIYDGTEAVNKAISGVTKTIIEAAIIVLIVLMLFLGNIRAVLVPLITIPISIIGVYAIISLFGGSINLVTLLAIILSIGLVVDDAIVVLENIHRHLEAGETPFRAAILGTREISLPVIVMTLTLVVVFLPVAFTPGAIGGVYKEFAITLAGTVLISGVVALTLSPLMVAYLYRDYKHSHKNRFEDLVERALAVLARGYQSTLNFALNSKKTIIAFIVVVFASTPFILTNLTSETMPEEDRGVLMIFAMAQDNVSSNYAYDAIKPVLDKIAQVAEVDKVQTIGGFFGGNSLFNIVSLKNDRNKTKAQIEAEIQPLLKAPGMQAFVFSPPEIETDGGGGFFNFSVEILSPYDFSKMIVDTTNLLEKLKQDRIIGFGRLSVQFKDGKLDISIDREKAVHYGVSISDIGNTLASYLSGRVVSRVSIDNKIYSIYTKIPEEYRNSTNAFSLYGVTSKTTGKIIPLSDLVSVNHEGTPSMFSRFNQLNSISINGVPLASNGQVVEWMNNHFNQFMDSAYKYEYKGDLRTYTQGGGGSSQIIIVSVILIFLLLASQFASWRDGGVIMITIPLAVAGSILVLFIFGMMQHPGASLNIYTTIGLVTLIGLITKHGILMLDFAKQQQLTNGLTREQAIRQAAAIRLRPILMTTVSMVAGLIPLFISSGTGENARFSIALVIVAGLSIGTLFTLYVLPVIYVLFGKNHQPEQQFDETQIPLVEQLVSKENAKIKVEIAQQNQ